MHKLSGIYCDNNTGKGESNLLDYLLSKLQLGGSVKLVKNLILKTIYCIHFKMTLATRGRGEEQGNWIANESDQT